MKKSLSRHTNYALNLTPHYKRKFDLGGSTDNITTAYIGDNSTKSVLNNLGGGTNPTGIVAGVEGMLESGLQNAKVASTYNIQSNIADNFGQALSNQNLNTNDQLMEAWDQYSPMQHIHKKDVRGGSTLGRLYNTGMSTIKGAEAGWNAGGEYGAILGAVVGLGTGVGGWLAGDKSASKLRDRLNKEIDIANQFGYENLANQQSNVEQKNLLRAEGNYVAYGGPLDKRLAGHQMQQIYGNGIPSANRFSKGGNAFIALGDQQTQATPMEEAQKEKSLIDTLMPYIMRAKEQREARERAEAEQQYRAEYEARVEAQRQAQAEALAQAYGEAAVAETAAPEYSNKALLDSIKRFEGFSPRPVWDVTGYAIGYGDHNKKINDYYLTHPNENYSEEEASKLIEQTVADTRKILAENIPNWNELSYAQQDALTSYGYNTGPWKIINNSPSLMKALANKDWNAAAAAINRGWNQRNEKGQLLKGLRKRRNFERLAFLYPEMTTYGVLPDGTVVNPDDLVDVDLSKPYTFENGKWSNPIEYTVATDDTMPVYVSQKSYGGNLFAYGNPPTKAYPRLTQAQHLKELQALAAKYPELEGISTKEFVPWLNALAGTESTYNPYARSVNKGGKKGSYVGYYQLHENELGNDYSPDNQFKKAFKHLAGIFKNQMTKEDVLQAKKKGITPMQALYKYWNQGNRVTNWLYYNKDKADGAETLISEYGNDYNPKDTYDYSNYLRDANKAPYYVLRPGDSYYKASLGARNPSLIYNYTNYGVTDFPYNKQYPARNVGDTVALVNQPVEQFRKTVKAWDAKHAFGGNLIPPKKQALLDRINSTSKANFVERAKDPNRKSITLKDGKKGTHLLGWATEDNHAVVYPQIQEIDGNLVLFDNWRDAYNSAVERGDTLRMTPKEAKWYTKNYKEHYPFANGGNLFENGSENLQDPPEGVSRFKQTMQAFQIRKNYDDFIKTAKAIAKEKAKAENKVKKQIEERKKGTVKNAIREGAMATSVTGGYNPIDYVIEDAATYGKELGLENEYRNAAAKRTGVATLTALTVPASFGVFGAVPAAAADSYFMAEAAHNIKNNTAGPMDYAMLAIPAAKAMYPVAKFQEAFNVGSKSTNYVEKPVIKITKNDPFVKRLEEVTNKTITKKPIKETNIGDVYSDGIGYYDESGNQIAHIAGNKRPGNKVFIESSYIDPAYRHQGLGTQMYKNFNEFIYDKYGTTLHSSPYQHMSTVETSPGSGVFISPSSKMWRAFKNKGEATIEGQGLNHYYVMEKPTKTDIQWDSAFNKALEEGNTKEAERLFNLHRQVKGYSNNNEYHSTDNPYFTVFDINHSSKDGIPDPFIHTGTKEAAKQRGGKRMLKLNAKYNNLLKTYDGIQDSPMDIINEIDKVKNIPIKEKQDLYKKWRETISKTHYDDQHIAKQKLVKELLEKYGFDGIEYINKGEDVGSVSRGFVRPEQLKLSNIITYDDAGNMIPLSKRHDFNNPDIRYGLIPIGLGTGLGIGLNTKTKKK